jgi:hypothetical protein
MKISFTWRAEKVDSDGKAPIYLDTYLEGKRLRVPTGKKDFKRFSNRTKVILSDIVKKLDDAEYDCERKGVKITSELIKSIVKNEKQIVKSFFEYWEEWIEESKTRDSEVIGKISKEVLGRYHVILNRLKDFEVKTGYTLKY